MMMMEDEEEEEDVGDCYEMILHTTLTQIKGTAPKDAERFKFTTIFESDFLLSASNFEAWKSEEPQSGLINYDNIMHSDLFFWLIDRWFPIFLHKSSSDPASNSLKNTSLSCGRRHITCRKVENLIKAWGIYAIEASTSTSPSTIVSGDLHLPNDICVCVCVRKWGIHPITCGHFNWGKQWLSSRFRGYSVFQTNPL